MNEVFDMDITDLLDADSDFVKELRNVLNELGVEINLASLSTILQEYEISKIEFLKSHILSMIANSAGLPDGLKPDGPVRIMMAQDLGEPIDEPGENSDSELDTDLIS